MRRPFSRNKLQLLNDLGFSRIAHGDEQSFVANQHWQYQVFFGNFFREKFEILNF